jgi:hypothetical protein
MIEPLREIHARAFRTLGIVLPLLVVGGVRHRQPLPGAPRSALPVFKPCAAGRTNSAS